jgi:hypothetical protein
MQDVNIPVEADTAYLKATYKNPSKDPNKPTGIGHNDIYMICAGSQAVRVLAGATLPGAVRMVSRPEGFHLKPLAESYGRLEMAPFVQAG